MERKSPQPIIIYTDGSSLGNPGPGGYGCVTVFPESNEVVEHGGQIRETTNNRMELTAIMTALGHLKLKKIPPTNPIIIHTDSSYAINGITKWIHGWQKKNWMTMQKTPVLNADIWQPLNDLTKYFTKLKFVHVRGHAGVWGNERCDFIATEFASGKHPRLFHGKLSDYDAQIMPGTQGVSSSGKQTISVSQTKKSGSGKAYSYVSVINGKVQTHADWASCKDRVYGKAAKFKKVFNKEEEAALIKEWSN